jgi:putative spermidine/putrescine transport system ATP-binding protein
VTSGAPRQVAEAAALGLPRELGAGGASRCSSGGGLVRTLPTDVFSYVAVGQDRYARPARSCSASRPPRARGRARGGALGGAGAVTPGAPAGGADERPNGGPSDGPGAPAALRLDGVAVGFGAGPGLEGVSLAVAPGERVAVVGASGAGKTTLLRAVAGLAPVRAGRVLVARAGAPARDVTRLPPERRDAVYLHQTPTPFAHLSVWENVAFPLGCAASAARRSPARSRRRSRSCGSRRWARACRTRSPAASGTGWRSPAPWPRAPRCCCSTSPLSSLDPALRDEVREAIVRAQGEAGAALVLVTHDLDEAGLVAHRVAVLAERRLLQTAAPAELFARPASLAVARFLGVGAEVPGAVGGDGVFRSALGAWPLTGPGAVPAGRRSPWPAPTRSGSATRGTAGPAGR